MIEELQLKFIKCIPLLEQRALNKQWCIINNHCFKYNHMLYSKI